MTSQSNYELRYQDFSKEESTVKYTGVQMTAANYAAQLVLAHTLRDKTDAISLGARLQEKVISETHASNQAVPTDPNSQRERKWLVVYKDSTQYLDGGAATIPNTGYGKKFTLEVPCADLSLLPAGHSDHIDPADASLSAAITDYIAAFEAYQRSPYNGVAEVVELVAVGRNS